MKRVVSAVAIPLHRHVRYYLYSFVDSFCSLNHLVTQAATASPLDTLCAQVIINNVPRGDGYDDAIVEDRTKALEVQDLPCHLDCGPSKATFTLKDKREISGMQDHTCHPNYDKTEAVDGDTYILYQPYNESKSYTVDIPASEVRAIFDFKTNSAGFVTYAEPRRNSARGSRVHFLRKHFQRVLEKPFLIKAGQCTVAASNLPKEDNLSSLPVKQVYLGTKPSTDYALMMTGRCMYERSGCSAKYKFGVLGEEAHKAASGNEVNMTLLADFVVSNAVSHYDLLPCLFRVI